MADVRLPLYQRMRDEMLVNISTGRWCLDHPIPSESELAQQYKVALGTVRRAVDTLVNDQLLERKQGSGTFVRRPDFKQSLFRFFRQLNQQGESIEPKAEVLLCEERKAGKVEARALELREGAPVVYLERLRYIDDKPCLFEEIWLSSTFFSKLLEVPREQFGNLLYPFYEAHCDQRIARANETLSIDAATTRFVELLAVKEHQPVVRIERTALGFDGKALEFRRTWGDASTFHYQVTIG